MEKIKKIFALLLAICLVFFSAACENNKEDTAKETFFEHSTAVMTQNLDNKKIGWGFKKEKGKAPDIPEDMKKTLKDYDGVYIDEKAEKNLYLTFDEGYENGYTEKILDVLKQTDTPAAFFITGDYIKTQPALVKRMYEEGHIVANHTNRHPSMPDKTEEEIKQDLQALNKMYNDLTGDNMKYLRPPMGEYSERTLAITKKLGYKTVLWSFAYVDWEKNNFKGADFAYNQIMPYLHDGAIILLHAVSKDNADVLLRFIEDARKLGYTFKSLDEI